MRGQRKVASSTAVFKIETGNSTVERRLQVGPFFSQGFPRGQKILKRLVSVSILFGALETSSSGGSYGADRCGPARAWREQIWPAAENIGDV